MKIKTLLLQSMISKAIKGAGCSSFIPITQMCEIVTDAVSNKLIVRTRDDNNKFSVFADFECAEEFDVVVDIASFLKLVSKFTSEFVELTVEGEILKVKGNGSYKIPIELVNGEPIRFYTPCDELPDKPSETIYADDIRDLIKYHKASLPSKSQEKNMAQFNCYYLSNKGNYSTNTVMICNSMRKILSSPVLFSPKVMAVLSEFDDCIEATHYSDGHWQFTDEWLSYECQDMNVYLDDYPIDTLEGIVNSKEDVTYVRVPRMDIVNALSRLDLFIGVYDDNGINLSINESMIAFNTLNKSGIEVIRLNSKKSEFDPKTMRISADLLYSQLKAMTDDIISVGYGSDTFLVLKDETTTRVIALQKG